MQKITPFLWLDGRAEEAMKSTTMEWNKSIWGSSLDIGLHTLRLAVDTHAVTSHFAIPLLIKTPGGLVVEVTDGTAEYNATNYRPYPRQHRCRRPPARPIGGEL